MNRRYFLGAALSAVAAPALAKKTVDRPRILAFNHLHTDERLAVTYRVGDRYQRTALQEINHFFRDFRTGDQVSMDPQLLDILYDVKIHLGDPDARFDVLSGYRSPRTNQMLRETSGGVAKNSLHLTGQAIDVRFPDLPTRQIRDAAIALGRGGVGYYRRSDFVHLDTGAVRRWGA
ncbi:MULTISPECIES: YcbK family protein [unclassified Thiocapsa]|uniref:YcbK family protein n=1 Tax=unclassified Thiocapsa TaxID=2641286 RepID=UPI0035AFE473